MGKRPFRCQSRSLAMCHIVKCSREAKGVSDRITPKPFPCEARGHSVAASPRAVPELKLREV